MEENRSVTFNNIHVSINDILFIKNPFRLCDVVRVKDIMLSIAFQDYKLKVESIEHKEVYEISFNEILGCVVLKEGVDLYELFKRK